MEKSGYTPFNHGAFGDGKATIFSISTVQLSPLSSYLNPLRVPKVSHVSLLIAIVGVTAAWDLNLTPLLLDTASGLIFSNRAVQVSACPTELPNWSPVSTRHRHEINQCRQHWR